MGELLFEDGVDRPCELDDPTRAREIYHGVDVGHALVNVEAVGVGVAFRAGHEEVEGLVSGLN